MRFFVLATILFGSKYEVGIGKGEGGCYDKLVRFVFGQLGVVTMLSFYRCCRGLLVLTMARLGKKAD